MITEKTKLILRLVEEQKITAEEAFILMAPDLDPMMPTTPVEPFPTPFPYQPYDPYPAVPWWHGPFIVTYNAQA